MMTNLMTGAVVGPDCVPTHMLTTSIVCSALVLVMVKMLKRVYMSSNPPCLWRRLRRSHFSERSCLTGTRGGDCCLRSWLPVLFRRSWWWWWCWWCWWCWWLDCSNITIIWINNNNRYTCSLRHRHHLRIDKLEQNQFNSQAAAYSRNRDRGCAPPLIPSLMSPPGCRTRSPVFYFHFFFNSILFLPGCFPRCQSGWS